MLERTGVVDRFMVQAKESVEHDLHVEYRAIDEGRRVRAAVDKLQGEAGFSKSFYAQREVEKPPTNISSLTVGGVEVTELPDLQSNIHAFYKDLYAAREREQTAGDEFLTDLPQLSAEDRLFLERPVTLQELRHALGKMRKESSPGSDGLTASFYLKFWDALGPVLLHTFNDAVERGFPSESQRLGVITLLCKDAARTSDLNFWRPITKLNVDIKLFAKVFSVRLGQVIGRLVGVEQSGGVKGRSCYLGLVALRDAIHHARACNISSILYSIDQQKAFDMVNRDYLWEALRAFGFGPSFIRALNTLYADFSCSVIVNGHLGEVFPISRGIKQGCSLSPQLFALVIETFLRKVNSHPDIRGIPIPGTRRTLKYIAHVDDSNYLLRDIVSVNTLNRLFESYGRASGARKNALKSKATWVVPSRVEAPPADVTWSRAPFRVLGVLFGASGVAPENTGAVAAEFTGAIAAWKDVELTFRGKSKAITSCVFAKLEYLIGLVDLPAETITLLTRAVAKFIWNGSTERIKRVTVFTDVAKGGLGIPDLSTHIRATRITRLAQALGNCAHPAYHYAAFHGSYQLEFLLADGVVYDGPSARNVASHYQSVYADVRKLYPTFVPREWLKRAAVYSALLPPSVPRIETLVQGVPWDTTWTRLGSRDINGEARDVGWLAAHQVLPTRETLHKWRVAQTPFCDLCPTEIETVAHALYSCTNASYIWNVVKHLFALRYLLLTSVLYFNPLPVPKDLVHAFIVVVAEAKFCLWRVRGRRLLGGIGTHHRVVARLKGSVNHRLKLDYHRLAESDFKRLWCTETRNVVRFVNDKPFLNLDA